MGKIHLITGPVNVRDLFNDVFKLFHTKAKIKSLDLLLNIEPATPVLLEADATRLKQIVNNIDSNAIKFTSKGTVVIDVKYDTGKLCFHITDQGIGISDLAQKKIFNRYEQIKSTGKLKQKITEKGTGLGLSISKELVELMNGEISLKSEVGKGSCFQVEIPFDVATDVEKSNNTDHNQKFAFHVLLVDDRDINIKVGKLLLKNMGCTIDIAVNGQEALDLIASSDIKYDLILMDIQMPVMDGITAMKQIKERNLTEVPVYSLSAQVESNLYESSSEIGFSGYLTKPINKEKFSSLLFSVKK